ncbi:sensor histidine kinase [Ktedonobacter sp. SOSP1-52]|uniref:sensor histidine kinase n=1 Tax=Ktedonobacter sp. SOSP1-52 TaxID=2778366 RepID=UPI0019159832|nr:sensor histidine kinase [Ktedonobacter sp. SOSP1-52]GHO68783.1 sensor histidine kinase [Ktedonobacter sp. SOSP1-52]
MKLFLRDHRALLLLNFLQVGLIFLICWLGGLLPWELMLYALLLCLFLLVCYLIHRYYTLRPFYRRLSSAFESLDESMQHYGVAPLGESLQNLLQTQYRAYQKNLLRYQRRQEMHITFTNQWVHQMKTPLSVILLTTQDEDDARFVSIREESERLQKGLDMVLYAARLDTFEHDFRVEAVALRKTINDVIQQNKRLFIRNHVYPEVHIAPDILVLSDAKWLAFIFDQIIVNAIKYSANTQAKVSVSAQTYDDRVEVEVRDHGIGIPPQDLPRIFEAYFTGENGRTHRQSTGMGLYLAHEACQQLGHPIRVDSSVGQGTTLHLTFFRRAPKLTVL